MRNLILFAVAFSVCLTETDIEQLGYDVTEEDFKNYFGIPAEATKESGFAKNENFKVTDLADMMNDAEREEFAKFLEVGAAGAVPATNEAAPAEAPVKEEKQKKESAKDKKAREAHEANVKALTDAGFALSEGNYKKEGSEIFVTEEEAKTLKLKALTDKINPKVAAEKKPGVIASILDIISKSEKPINEDGIVEGLAVLFPEKTKDSMRNTVRAQVGGKTQPTRMEQEKGVTFVITTPEVKEGEKAVRFYALKK